MELFVVNRYEGDEPKQIPIPTLDKKLRRKEKKAARYKAINTTIKIRQKRREKKAKIIAVPQNENDEFIDKALQSDDETITTEKPTSKRQKKLEKTELDGFTILGTNEFDKKSKVKRILPKWLLNPTIISVNLQNLQTKVTDVKMLEKPIRKLLKANSIKYFFPVQATVIPWLLESYKQADLMFPRDICVSAPTGSGKTLAFVLPVIQALKRYFNKQIRALVILPTQELALQVFKAFRTYTENTNLDTCLITGKNQFSVEQKQLVYENKVFGYVSKVDILVCTAGRLVDHLTLTKGFNLKHLEFLIIDEADRVLESMQNDWLYHLEKHFYDEESNQQTGRIVNVNNLSKRRPPQKLLFSATLSQDPEKLEKLSLFQPKLFTSIVESGDEKIKSQASANTFVGKYTTPKELTEKYIVTSLDLKPLVLYQFIKSEKLTKTLIFTHSIETAHRLTILLKSLFENQKTVGEISSNLQSRNRTEFISKFSNGEIDLLVCTDAMARGIDLPNLQCVISYSAPKHLKTYIHRAGRTARAGEEGLTVTLLQKSQLAKFKSLLEQAEKTNVTELVVNEEDLEPLGDQYKEALESLKNTVMQEEQLNVKKNKLIKNSRGFKRKRKDSAVSSNSK